MDKCTLIEQNLADRDDGEELIDTKVEGIHLADKGQWPSQVSFYCVI